MMLQPISEIRPLPQAVWRQAPLFRFALAAVAGIALAWATKENVSAAGWAVSAVVAALAAVWSFARAAKRRALSAEKKYFKVLCLVWLSTLFVFALLTRLHVGQVVTSFPDESRLWVGRVESVAKVRDSSLTVMVSLADNNKEWDGKRVQVRLSREDGSFTPGQTIAFHAPLRTGREKGNPGSFNYGNYLATHHLSGTAYVERGAVRKLSQNNKGNGLQNLFSRWRIGLEKEYSALFTQTETALLAALTLGDKAMLADDTRDLFSSTGTSHVLALSGLHLGILFSVFNFLLLVRVRSRRSRLGVTALLFVLVWAYALLAGSPLSLLRAAAMLSLMLVGEALRRSQRSSLNNLSLAAIVLLLIDPLALFDVGFQLSFMAVFFIIVVQQYVWQRLPLPLWVEPPWKVRSDEGGEDNAQSTRGLLSIRCELLPSLANGINRRAYNLLRNVVVPFVQMSISAQWGTLPLVVYYFHQLTPYALVANFVAVPLAYVLLVGALLFFALPIPGLRLLLAKGLRHLYPDWLSRSHVLVAVRHSQGISSPVRLVGHLGIARGGIRLLRPSQEACAAVVDGGVLPRVGRRRGGILRDLRPCATPGDDSRLQTAAYHRHPFRRRPRTGLPRIVRFGGQHASGSGLFAEQFLCAPTPAPSAICRRRTDGVRLLCPQRKLYALPRQKHLLVALRKCGGEQCGPRQTPTGRRAGGVGRLFCRLSAGEPRHAACRGSACPHALAKDAQAVDAAVLRGRHPPARRALRRRILTFVQPLRLYCAVSFYR